MTVTKSSTDPMAKVIENMQALTIIQFIKENQNPEIGLTMDRVAKAMHEKGVCSRPTTLKLIDELLRVGVLLDQKRKKNEFHDLIVNPDKDFKPLLKKKFRKYVEDIKQGFDLYESLIEDKEFKRTIRESVDKIERAVSDT